MPVEYYHATDPLENLRLRVVVRELARSKTYDDRSRTREREPFFVTDQLLSWQQKLFSPSDVADYIISKDVARQRGKSSSPTEMRNLLRRLEQNGVDVRQLLAPVMLYTAIDREQFEEHADVSLGIDRRPPQRLVSDRPFKSMHICLATNVQVDELLSEKREQYSKHYSRHILCSLRIYQHGLVEVTPGLTKPDHANVFLTDAALHAALRKGFALQSQSLHDQFGGSDFEYVVLNARDVLVPHRAEELLRRERVLDSLRSLDIRAQRLEWSQRTSAVSEPVLSTVCSVLRMEIVSGARFSGRRVFVAYSLQSQSTDGEKGKELVKGRTHASLQSFVPNRNHHSPKGGRAWTRLLIASILFLISVLSVALLGSTSLFWLVCALALLLVAGRGLPLHSSEPQASVLFNHLFHTVVFTDAPSPQELSVAQRATKLFLTVYSVGFFDELRIEGYATMKLDIGKPVVFDESIQVFRHRQRSRDELRRLFLGGGARFREDAFAGEHVKRSKLNAFAMLTEDTGTVRVRGEVGLASAAVQIESSAEQASPYPNSISSKGSVSMSATFNRTGTGTAVRESAGQFQKSAQRSVADILQAFKAKQIGDKRGAIGASSVELSQRQSLTISKGSHVDMRQRMMQRIRQAKEAVSLHRHIPDESQGFEEDELSALLQPTKLQDNEERSASAEPMAETMGLQSKRDMLHAARKLASRYDESPDASDKQEDSEEQPLLQH